jgi:hypothetical protein
MVKPEQLDLLALSDQLAVEEVLDLPVQLEVLVLPGNLGEQGPPGKGV